MSLIDKLGRAPIGNKERLIGFISVPVIPKTVGELKVRSAFTTNPDDNGPSQPGEGDPGGNSGSKEDDRNNPTILAPDLPLGDPPKN